VIQRILTLVYALFLVGLTVHELILWAVNIPFISEDSREL